jgi:hypothetical protein
VALFRANGVPARLVHVIPSWAGLMDMHWNAEYWHPGYGWILVEPGSTHPNDTMWSVTTFIAQPHDEFPLFFATAIDGMWYSSDPLTGMPDWGRAHSSRQLLRIDVPSEWLEAAMPLTHEVHYYSTRLVGTRLIPDQEHSVDQAEQARSDALQAILAEDIDGYLSSMGAALDHYRRASPRQITTVYLEDFENGEGGWSHHGLEDEWELGAPTHGPAAAHSGVACWGTDLDDTYNSRADNWLRSPWISLEGLASAYLSFWVYNSVQDAYNVAYDPLWLDITTDDSSYRPLSSEMLGVNDDPEIPASGGWSRMVLDLGEYIDAGRVRVRFRFRSGPSFEHAGAYIDDVEIFGRIMGAADVPRMPGGRRVP